MHKVTLHNVEVEGWGPFGDVLDFTAVNQYSCAVKEILQQQRDNGINNIRKDDLDSDRMNQLMKMVKSRKNKVTKAMFKERSSGAFQPFKMIQEIPRIEKYLWDYPSSTLVNGASALRDRYHFLMCLCGVLRSESMYLADLADLCDFMLHPDCEPDPYHILIMRIGEGKVNADGTEVFGRVMRHKDPRLCAILALAIYLCMRFDVTGEIESIDFANNNTWFNRKLIKAMPRSAWCGSTQTDNVVEGEGTTTVVAPVAARTIVTAAPPVTVVNNNNVMPVPITTPPLIGNIHAAHTIVRAAPQVIVMNNNNVMPVPRTTQPLIGNVHGRISPTGVGRNFGMYLKSSVVNAVFML